MTMLRIENADKDDHDQLTSQDLVSVLVLYVGTYVPISMYISPCIVLVDVTAAFF